MSSIIREIALIAAMMSEAGVDLPEDEVVCMARNIYHEARDQDAKGQAAVAHVTMNRVRSAKHPNTVCSVVKQDTGSKSWDCQFSWWCDGKSDRPSEWAAYKVAVKIGIEVMAGQSEDITQGAQFYLTSAAYKRIVERNGWAKRLELSGQIGDHLFLRHGA